MLISAIGHKAAGYVVNMGARLEGLAAPGGICISASVHEQMRDRIRPAFRGSERAACQEYHPSGRRMAMVACLFRRRNTNGRRGGQPHWYL